MIFATTTKKNRNLLYLRLKKNNTIFLFQFPGYKFEVKFHRSDSNIVSKSFF